MLRLVLPLALAAASAFAVEVEDAHVREALDQAGANRDELEAVLARFANDPDPRKLVAARFLIANMPGHGYIVTTLRDAKNNVIDYDPLRYPDLEAAQAALDELEKKHGELTFARDHLVPDVETITADFLTRHIDAAFRAWERTPESARAGFDAFVNYLLPYRGSQEPIEDWLGPLMRRYGHVWSEESDRNEVARRVRRSLKKRVFFNERFYLHPTDQGFGEMLLTGQGRCEDLSNLDTYAMRAMSIVTATDYTPYWAHRDNNHAWPVMLDADGRGFAPANAHAAKVYRKTFAIQRQSLPFLLPEGRTAANRFMADKFSVDVTDQYGETSEITVEVDAGGEGFAYLCVFNGGEWKPVCWARVRDGRATFARLGRNVAYLPAVHDGETLIPAAPPLILTKEGSVAALPGGGREASLVAVAVSPGKVSPDTAEVTPASRLAEGTEYVLQRWDGEWTEVARAVATTEPLRFHGLCADGLYWLVAEKSRRLERIFTIVDGRQKWW